MSLFGGNGGKLRSIAPQFIVAMMACWALVLLCAGRSEAEPRTPLGVYAHVDVPGAIKADITGRKANPKLKGVTIGPCSALPSTAQSIVHDDLQKLYASLLRKSTSTASPTDPVSGIELGVPWCLVHPCDPSVSQCTACEPGSSPCKLPKEDWSWISDVFDAIGSDPSLSGKTVQLSINPGFDTPQWVLTDLINSVGSCDGYFNGSNTPSPSCGTVTFTNFPECPHATGSVLPLPWNSMYAATWQAFLKDLWTTFQSEQALVSIAIAGPSGASPEFIFPTTDNKSYVYWNKGVARDDCSKADRGTNADAMWTKLINAQIPGPNSSMYSQFPLQVFVDYWNNAIDAYEGIFSGITLVLTPDSGSDFPEIGSPLIPGTTTIVGVDNKTANTLWAVDCSTTRRSGGIGSDYTLSCGAKVEILAHFILAQTYVANASNNARSAYIGGMTSSSCTKTGFIGLPGVKVLTSWSSLSSLPRQPFVGGAQFDHPVSQTNKEMCEMGCPKKTTCCPTSPTCASCTPEVAAYDTLTDFFNATADNTHFNGAAMTECPGKEVASQPAPIQYVNINYDDIQHAKEEICPNPAQAAIQGTCTTVLDLLNQTQYYLGAVATAPSASCPYAPPSCAPSSCEVSSRICPGCSKTCGPGEKAICTAGSLGECPNGHLSCACGQQATCLCQSD